MSHELLAEKIKQLPEQALEKVSDYVDYIYTIYVKESDFENQDVSHRLSLLENLQNYRGRFSSSEKILTLCAKKATARC